MTESETRVGHCRSDEIDVYVGRGPDGRNIRDTPIGERGWLGNCFVIESNATQAHRDRETITLVATREEAVERFREVFEELLADDDELRRAVRDLSGSRLGGWCQTLDADGPACHAEVIAEWADRLASDD